MASVAAASGEWRREPKRRIVAVPEKEQNLLAVP